MITYSQNRVLAVRDLSRRFGRGCPRCSDPSDRRLERNYCPDCGTVYALEGIDLELYEGEVLGIVGESGSGKSTLMGCLYFDQEPSSGTGYLAGYEGGTVDVFSASGQRKRDIRNRLLGMVYQNPLLGLKMNFSALSNIAEKMIAAGHRRVAEMEDRARSLLTHVNIPPARMKDPPATFSGGMQQRVQIAKALSNNPPVLLLDEVTTGLDLSVQAKVLDLIKLIQRDFGVSMVLVSHDLGVVRMLAAHGITTMFHSLSFYKDGDFGHNPIRSSENTARLMELVHRSHGRQHLIRHRFHARFEIDNTDRVEELTRHLRDGKIHLLSFMDHTPGQGQFRNLEIYRKTIKGYRNMSEGELDRMIEDIQTRKRLTADDVAEIAGIAAEHGVAVASHDDDTPEKLALVKSFGTRISEFPITLEIAREARRLGLHTVAGAPNILLGGSHSGNLSAAKAILDGSVDVLCSDYYPAALLHAVFRMHREHGLPLNEMVNLATRNAAAAVGMDAELGSLESGKKADLLVVDELEDEFPVVAAAFVDGLPVLRTSYRR